MLETSMKGKLTGIVSVLMLFFFMAVAAYGEEVVIGFDDGSGPYWSLPSTPPPDDGNYEGFWWDYGSDSPQVISDAQLTAYGCTRDSPSGDYQVRVADEPPKAIAELMIPPEKPRKRIGFEVKEGRAKYGKGGKKTRTAKP